MSQKNAGAKPKTKPETKGSLLLASELSNNEELLVGLPIWGWQGDGKSSAILTAVHYMSAQTNGLQMAPIIYMSELATAEKHNNLSLVAVAKNTRQSIDELNRQFIEEATWVPGTDTGMSYLFKVANLRGTCGFLYLPDLPGGNYQEGRDDAEGVLNEADGLIVIVDPEKYVASGQKSKIYKQEIIGKIHFAGRRGLPLAVFVTKSDKFLSKENSKLDDIRNELTIVLDAATQAPTHIFYVSVMGSKTATQTPIASPALLPKESDRNPDEMLSAWIWIISNAFTHAGKRNAPAKLTLSIQAFQSKAKQLAGKPQLEIRHAGEYSSIPGIIIASIEESSSGTARLICLAKDGKVYSSSWSHDQLEKPNFQEYGQLESFDLEPSEIVVHTIGGDAIVGATTETDCLWLGGLGGALRKTQLPFKAVSWEMVSGDRVIALNEEGKLFSLSNSGTKWNQIDYLNALSTIEKGAFLKYVAPERLCIVSNGTEPPLGIILEADHRFGEKREIEYKFEFTGFDAKMNASLFIGKSDESKLTIRVGSVSESIESISESISMIGIGQSSNRAAYFNDENKLMVVTAPNGKITQVPYADAFEEPYPNRILWSCQDRVVFLSFGDTINVFRILGFES